MRFLAVCLAAATVAVAAVILASTKNQTPSALLVDEEPAPRFRALPGIRMGKAPLYPVRFSLN